MRKDYGVVFEIEMAVSESPTTKQPQAFLLQQSYPNPFNGEATLLNWTNPGRLNSPVLLR